MFKKIVAILIAGTMMISSATAVMAGEPDKSVIDIDLDGISTVGDDAGIKGLLEGILGDVTDEEGTFECDQMRKLIGRLYGNKK